MRVYTKLDTLFQGVSKKKDTEWGGSVDHCAFMCKNMLETKLNTPLGPQDMLNMF